jgi:hypothetical protein
VEYRLYARRDDRRTSDGVDTGNGWRFVRCAQRPADIQVEAYQKGLIPYVPGVDMEKLDALIKEHGYIRLQLVEGSEADDVRNRANQPETDEDS